MHACTHTHACMHACTHTCMHACTQTHTHTHTKKKKKKNKNKTQLKDCVNLHLSAPCPSSLSAPPPSSSSSVKQPRQSTDTPTSKESTVNNGTFRGVMLDLTLAQDLRMFFKKVCPVQQRLRSLRKQGKLFVGIYLGCPSLFVGLFGFTVCHIGHFI